MSALCRGSGPNHGGIPAHNCGPFTLVFCRESSGNFKSFGGNDCFEGETGATDREKQGRTKASGSYVAYVVHIPPRLLLLTDLICNVRLRIEWNFCSSFQLHFQVGNTARCRMGGDKVQSSLNGQDSMVSGQDAMLGGAYGGHPSYVGNESSNHVEHHNEEYNKHRA